MPANAPMRSPYCVVSWSFQVPAPRLEYGICGIRIRASYIGYQSKIRTSVLTPDRELTRQCRQSQWLIRLARIGATVLTDSLPTERVMCVGWRYPVHTFRLQDRQTDSLETLLDNSALAHLGLRSNNVQRHCQVPLIFCRRIIHSLASGADKAVIYGMQRPSTGSEMSCEMNEFADKRWVPDRALNQT